MNINIVEEIIQLFTRVGQGEYFGEQVSETEHALQTAHLAVQAGVDEELIAAALLHDIGHLLHGLPESIAQDGIDGRHEDGGSAWLQHYFGPAVSAPVRLHVAAKRYLCAIEPEYLAGLSPASQRSLKLQGGPFDEAGIRGFEAERYFQSAVAVRRWDDAAKTPNLVVPGLDAYRSALETALARSTTR